MAVSGRDMAMQAPMAPAAIVRGAGLLDRYAPMWALRAAREVGDLPPSQRIVILVAALLVFAVGFVFAVGGGYWSIQGVRLLLDWAHIRVALAGIPAPQWWLIPIGNTIVQVVTHPVPALRRYLWAPSVCIGGTTTAAFMAVLLLERLPDSPFLAIIAASAMIGMTLEIVIEHILLGMLVIIRAAWQR